MTTIHSHSNQCKILCTPGINRSNNNNNNINNQSKRNKVKKKKGSKLALIPLPTLGATSFVTLLTIICIETVLLSTMSSCAKTFYMHWNTSNSIFRIDNTDHIIDVNKGNLAFEFDQVHIICPVYEPGAFENETEKYIIYNVSKVEYETCRITNADPRVIAICDKPQKLMFFTITFRPFTPQPGGLEFLPGNDYYFISTSSKDDLYRRIGGRCSTNNMKVVFKVCCAAEEKNKTTAPTTLIENTGGAGTGMGTGTGSVDNTAINVDVNVNGVNTIGVNTANAGNTGNIHLKPINGLGTSINTNIDQFNRIPIQPNIIGNNIGQSGVGGGAGGVILSPGHGSINMLPPGRGGIHLTYPGHHHIQTGIRINNVPTNVQQNQNNPNMHSHPPPPHPHHKQQAGNNNLNANGNDDHHGYDKHPNEVVKNEELTYNSGTQQSHLCKWNWNWIIAIITIIYR
ncbi:GH24017 [Drosophila grimshawi]|uniref:GH24017 n=2 Tax=Drosophila grimshawi TaxID=7222 RepID=B4JZW4_DROGR|nr:GH24017 [Drosophila grimshawi]